MLRRALVFVALGLVVNVALAWVCAAWSHARPAIRALAPAPADTAWWSARAPEFSDERLVAVDKTKGFGVRLRLLTAASLRLAPEIETNTLVVTKPYDNVVLLEAGWPMRCASGEQWRLDITSPIYSSRIPVLALRGITFAETRTVFAFPTDAVTFRPLRFIPLRPLWPGFAVDTLFWAAVLWLAVLGPGAVLRAVRRRRGRCPGCGYDLRAQRGERCPECGWPGSAGVKREAPRQETGRPRSPPQAGAGLKSGGMDAA